MLTFATSAARIMLVDVTLYDSCRYYTECFGMKLLRKRDIPEEKYTNAFLGFGPEDTNFAVELTYSMFSDLPNFLFICFTMLLIFTVAQFVNPIRKLAMDIFLSLYALI